MENRKWTREQAIAFGGLAVAVIALFVQINSLEQKIQPIIEMKPQIVNVIENVTRVEKEIANIQDTLIQEDKARISEVFTMKDLDKRVKEVLPPDSQGPYAAALVMVELNKIPLKNSIVVQTQIRSFAGSAIHILGNILEIRFLKAIPPDVLAKDTDFIEVSYIPDPENKQELYTLKGFKVVFDDDQKGLEGQLTFGIRK